MRRTIPTVIASAALVLGMAPGAFAATSENGNCEGDTPAPTCAPPPVECVPYIEEQQTEVARLDGLYRHAVAINQRMAAEDVRQRARIEHQAEVIDIFRWAIRQDERQINRLLRVKHRQAREIRQLRRQLAAATS